MWHKLQILPFTQGIEMFTSMQCTCIWNFQLQKQLTNLLRHIVCIECVQCVCLVFAHCSRVNTDTSDSIVVSNLEFVFTAIWTTWTMASFICSKITSTETLKHCKQECVNMLTLYRSTICIHITRVYAFKYVLFQTPIIIRTCYQDLWKTRHQDHGHQVLRPRPW